MKVEVTKQLLAAIKRLTEYNNIKICSFQESDEYKTASGVVYDALSEAIEQDFQDIDIIDSWLERAKLTT